MLYATEGDKFLGWRPGGGIGDGHSRYFASDKNRIQIEAAMRERLEW